METPASAALEPNYSEMADDAAALATDQEAHESTETEAFAGRLFEAALGAIDLLAIHLGQRLGFFRAMADALPTTSGELATRTGTHERYAREWLEQQAVSDILEVVVGDDEHAKPSQRRYRLPVARAVVLLHEENFAYLGSVPGFAVAIAHKMDVLVEAFRSGGGVPWAAYGGLAREGQAGLNRAVFAQLLTSEWLPAMPDVHACLQARARVADVGCGGGWSSIEIARAYPKVYVEGFDSDPESIELARSHAADAGVSDRVTFHAQDVSKPPAGTYDLVTAFETIHDMSRPVEALRGMRQMARPLRNGSHHG